MMNFIGIDLGTTNSAICSYNGSDTRIWKSPEQNDVTPSAIYIDRRGHKFYGKRAYDAAPLNSESAATLFKRLMGTSTPIKIPAVNLVLTPEQCSAEILKVLFGYLPEEIRNAPETGTVITVPAAFNQMQKDATMDAARIAEIGNVALMQEPVAAVMSVMRTRKTEGLFLIYDLGGGTLDVAIAESLGGHVSLLAHGGIAMCGGRDFDRKIFDNIVKPWLFDNFNLPEDLSINPSYKRLCRIATWASERAKMELSSSDEAIVSLSEPETLSRDLDGKEIFLEIPISREKIDELIEEKILESIEAARATISKTGLSPHDIERIVFVGGPTHFKPLRDRVSFELGIPGNTDVNPMTAVAEGASIFAESIDWQVKHRPRKGTRGQVSAGGKLSISFNFQARTPEGKARIIAQVNGDVKEGAEFQVDNMDTGWSSGRMVLKDNVFVDLPLPSRGENHFKVFVFDSAGAPIALKEDRILISRTAATVDAIPASHSIAIEALNKVGGSRILDFLVRSGDPLPVKGKKNYKAAQSLKAGSTGALFFNLWEGEIEDPVQDNRPIGVLKISGDDFDKGVIPAGADLVCEYEILDSGNIVLEVSIPCIPLTISSKNLYSRQESEPDVSQIAAQVLEDGESALNRIEEISKVVEDEKLDHARKKLDLAIGMDPDETDLETMQEAMNKVLEARILLSEIRKKHLKEIRQLDLNSVSDFFEKLLRQYAKQTEAESFDNLVKTAQRSIDKNEADFENHLSELKGKNFEILWRQDWFVVEKFKRMAKAPHLFADKSRYKELVEAGIQFVKSDQTDKLRQIVGELFMIQVTSGEDDGMLEMANIIVR